MNRQINQFNKQAAKYERMRKNNLFRKYRPDLFREAFGDVLELSIGVGNNFEHYRHIAKLTGVDFSSEMLKYAERESKKYPFETTLIEADIESLNFDENSFDTIVSSLSFCGYREPVKVLNKIEKWCRPGGRVLLMEHGISKNPLLALMQKLIDPLSLKAVGCHQKRDIEKIVRQSNLDVIRVDRRALGCIYLIRVVPKA